MGGFRMATRPLSGSWLPRYHCTRDTVRTLSACPRRGAVDGRPRPSSREDALPSWSREGALSPRHQTTGQNWSGHRNTKRYVTSQAPGENYVSIPNTGPGAWHPVLLRDACPCPQCIDTSTTQKNFNTTHIPETIRAKSVEPQDDGDVKVTWENDIPGYGPDHVSIYPAQLLRRMEKMRLRYRDRSELAGLRLWDRKRIREELQYIDYEEYMKSDRMLFNAISLLQCYGILLLRRVPKSEESVEAIAGRIGKIRDTFYGRTWDVKSVPKAKNVAYTHQFLGLHMDLLYMQNPPGLQLLHCLENTCQGGQSIFSDSFYAVRQLEHDDLETLRKRRLAYHYRNGDQHYYHERPVLEMSPFFYERDGALHRSPMFINYSPPFQANIPLDKAHQDRFPDLVTALRNFASEVESPMNMYEYSLQEGECVIFNNRRVLHGRREFDTGQGHRWLKGTYVDTDVFKSRYRVLQKQIKYKNPQSAGELQELHKARVEKAKSEGPFGVPDIRLESLPKHFVHKEDRRKAIASVHISRAREFEAEMFGTVVNRKAVQEDDGEEALEESAH
ncbi:uncharacterized protein L3040_009490 [Drepanopeziza brunnea f. sp. 'multigermtubi']|uniref:Gamma-butyrobetaine dioxygenase n=1 Tax=Marssonina brunnea f. sp. multigermtubi (strain MB_m1) TaxID=1072389 RepID=K1WUZ9_MARBU|nr:gamma-butyrobetaine dioxygenase [Drepanopeziza brunnea f. sp. 'multigermtubi' MB_m1]EKD16277.1 gamma-butyrobetaine dioxygenase [Drepanopeziza brunnea f. sp. 'multigermtubi' MB_m1]KAJ5032899.1 hypothetical protein L3040_009490 [Drepanopeziza brunnea f. sp. 'multigermtubi']